MKLPILTYGDPRLRKKATPVVKVDEALADLAKNMLETMYDAPGIGLAAPQVGKNIRLLVADVGLMEGEEKKAYILFNPIITQQEGESLYDEGCLSFPGLSAYVKRPEKISICAIGVNGKQIELNNIDGLLARCIQHEMDHLEGILFIDYLSATEAVLISGKLKKLLKQKKEI